MDPRPSPRPGQRLLQLVMHRGQEREKGLLSLREVTSHYALRAGQAAQLQVLRQGRLPVQYVRSTQPPPSIPALPPAPPARPPRTDDCLQLMHRVKTEKEVTILLWSESWAGASGKREKRGDQPLRTMCVYCCAGSPAAGTQAGLPPRTVQSRRR